MIRVVDLCRRFGDVQALSGVSFAVGRGEVLGVLGPNGAGKTTALRILAAYLSPTGGLAEVAGVDVTADPIAARRAVGYLPEGAPLYGEMRVTEYLAFRGRLRGLDRRARRAAVEQAIERCGLDEVRRRVIGALSRGLRQRVGLADALLASPPVLLLDEPTAGLDPVQAQAVRALVRELGRERTVIFSSHLLSEVEATCDRVVILARGRVAADAPLAALAGGSGPAIVVVGLRGDAEAAARRLAALPGVARVEELSNPRASDARVDTGAAGGEPSLRVTALGDAGPELRAAIARAVAESGAALTELRCERTSLEQLFLRAVAGEARA